MLVYDIGETRIFFMNFRRLKNLGLGVFARPGVNILLPPYRERLVSVFMLHRMQSWYSPDTGHSPELLRQALFWLHRRGYQFVSLREIFAWIESGVKPPRNAVAFTLDDGYLDQARIAAPIFAEFGIRCTIFTITDFLDGRSWPWDARIRYIFSQTRRTSLSVTWKDREFRYDLSDEPKKWAAMRSFREYCKHVPGADVDGLVRELARAGDVDVSAPPRMYEPLGWDEARRLEKCNVDFAPHTRNHYSLSGLEAEEANHEIIGSWRRLQQELADPVPVLAYPTGRLCDITVREVTALKQAGLVGAVTTEPGYVHFDDAKGAYAKRFFINRFSYSDDISRVFQYSSKVEYFNMKLRYVAHLIRYAGLRRTLRCAAMQLRLRLGGYRSHQNIQWGRVKRLVFVCRGNLCRSPYAEARARAMCLPARSFGLDVVQDRRDLVNERAGKNAEKRYVDLNNHTSRTLTDMDLNEGDLVLGMEPWHLEQLKERGLPDGCQLSLMGLWADHKAVVILDPYGQDDECFQSCFDQIDSALLGLAGHVTDNAIDYQSAA